MFLFEQVVFFFLDDYWVIVYIKPVVISICFLVFLLVFSSSTNGFAEGPEKFFSSSGGEYEFFEWCNGEVQALQDG